MHVIPGLSPRAAEEAGILSVDDADMGEFAWLIGIKQEIGHTPGRRPKSPMPGPKTQHKVDSPTHALVSQGRVLCSCPHARVQW